MGRLAGSAVLVLLALTGCGRAPGTATVVASKPSPTPITDRLPLCDPAAADYQKHGMPTPAPCISFDPDQQMRDNAMPRQRRSPQPSDVAAVQPAAADLKGAFADLRARRAFDEASVQQAIGSYQSLRGARAHPPHSEKLTTVDATVIVVLDHGSACLMGEHGPTQSVVYVVGTTLDGGCEALYGH